LPHSIRDGPDENLTSRVIEIPESPERFELRDPKSGFVAYDLLTSTEINRRWCTSAIGRQQQQPYSRV
jgi:hypothetical protein